MVKRSNPKLNDSPGLSLVRIDLAAGSKANIDDEAQKSDKKRSRREPKPHSLPTGIPKKKVKFTQPDTPSVDLVRKWLNRASDGELDKLVKWVAKKRGLTEPTVAHEGSVSDKSSLARDGASRQEFKDDGSRARPSRESGRDGPAIVRRISAKQMQTLNPHYNRSQDE